MKREDRCERKGEQPRQPETSHRSVCGRSRLKILHTLLQSLIGYEIEVDYTPSRVSYAYLFLFKTMEGKLIMSIKSVLAGVLELHAAQLT
ncbi:hypothetical protein G5I_05347 [Acromyrmex echinatior]|uniref:Uncharacterized protein n=1 Tax=Acromyrmex echinatior TaxID=103372 RepID=F4WI25_ACREC|nr:hypothetical protein G5I_05347 [Acromyrmex echinatior]